MSKGLLAGTCLGILGVFYSSTCLGQVKAQIENFEGYHEGQKDLNAGALFIYGSIVSTVSTVQGPATGKEKSLQVSWSGKDTYGGWGKGLGMELTLNPAEDHFNILVKSSSLMPVTLQLILQEDDNGDGIFNEAHDDAWMHEIKIEASAPWQIFSLPLSAFKKSNTGGDGYFNVNAKEGRLLAFVVNYPNLNDSNSTGNWYFKGISLSKGKITLSQASTHAEKPAPVMQQVHKPKKSAKEWEHMGDVLGSDKMLLGKNRLSATISYSMGRFISPETLIYAVTPTSSTSPTGPSSPTSPPKPAGPSTPRPGGGTTSPDPGTGTEPEPITEEVTQYNAEFRNALVLSTKVRLFEEFYINGSFFKNFNPNTIQVWTADYFYSIGRYNWRPNTFSYGYENFMDNRYNDSQGFLRKFLQGHYFVSYGHNVPEKLFAPFKIDNTSGIKLNYFVRYASHYRDIYNNLHGGTLEGKPSLGVSMRYTIARNLYVESAVYQFIKPATRKMPWDPDYSYGFGYFNYKSFRASVTYANWVANRFPWNPKEITPYGILDGDLRVTVNLNW